VGIQSQIHIYTLWRFWLQTWQRTNNIYI